MAQIHLNNAGASIVSERTYDRYVEYLSLERSRGPYEAADLQQKTLSDLRSLLGTLTGLSQECVALMDSASRAWNTLVYSMSLQQGDVVIVSQLEFGSMLAALVHHFVPKGVKLWVAPVDRFGRIDSVALQDNWPQSTKLVAITHAPAHLPLLNPIEDIAKLAAANGCPILVDACQSLGSIPFPALGNPRVAICGTGRKWLRGPRGTGFLAVSKAWADELDPPTADLANTDAENLGKNNLGQLHFEPTGKKFELWEKNVAALVGLHQAVSEYIQIDSATVAQTIIQRANSLKTRLSNSAAGRVLASQLQETGVIGIAVTSDEKDRLKQHFVANELNVSIMSAWDAPLDFEARNVTHVLRMAPHVFNTEAELGTAARIVSEAFL